MFIFHVILIGIPSGLILLIPTGGGGFLTENLLSMKQVIGTPLCTYALLYPYVSMYVCTLTCMHVYVMYILYAHIYTCTHTDINMDTYIFMRQWKIVCIVRIFTQIRFIHIDWLVLTWSPDQKHSVSGRNKCMCSSSHVLCYGCMWLCAIHNFILYGGDIIHACHADKAEC